MVFNHSLLRSSSLRMGGVAFGGGLTLVFLDLCSLKTKISHKTNIKDPMGNTVISNHLEELNPTLPETNISPEK